MSKTFRLRILRRHINASDAATLVGQELRSRSCPIAQALKERGYTRPAVGGQWWADGVEGTFHSDAQNFITAYDNKLGVKPCRVTLEIN